MLEKLEPIEPVISEQYLNSGADVSSEIAGLLDGKNGGGIRLKPKSLSNSPYFLQFNTRWAEKLKETQLSVRLVDVNGENVNDRETGCDLFLI